MEEIREFYVQGKYVDCLKLLKLEWDTSTKLQYKLENELNTIVCQSALKLISISTNRNYISAVELELLRFYEKIVSLGAPNGTISLDVELAAWFNHLWWTLQFNTETRFNEARTHEILGRINKGLSRGRPSVLMSNQPEEEIFFAIKEAKKMIFTLNYVESMLFLEIIVVIFMIVLKLLKQPESVKALVDVLQFMLRNLEMHLKAAKSNEIKEKAEKKLLLEFSMGQVMSQVGGSTPETIMNELTVVGCLGLLRMKDYQACLMLVGRRPVTSLSALLLYLSAHCCYALSDLQESLGYLLLRKSEVVSDKLQCRCYVLLGRLYAANGDHAEALKFFRKANDLDSNLLPAFYYQGQEYCRMELYEMMTTSFKEMVKVLERKGEGEGSRCLNFEEMAIQVMHPRQEVTLIEANYALAVAYGLDEKFQDASGAFEKVVAGDNLAVLGGAGVTRGTVVQVPPATTVLHEASIVSLLSGNLVRAEQLCMDAMDRYCEQRGESEGTPPEASHAPKDARWLQQVLVHELGLTSAPAASSALPPPPLFEQLLLGFDDDIIGLMTLAEIRRIQDGDYKETLGKLLSLFSKYLSTTQKSANGSEKERQSMLLSKALAAKCCLNIAVIQTKTRSEDEVEKMFKRALSCNNGDKDVLYNFALFLLRRGRRADASKLLKTFYDKESDMSGDQCQSLALRYLLRVQVTERQLTQVVTEAGGSGC